MYQVYADETLLYDPRVQELALISPKLSLEENKAGSFTFILNPKHPYYELIKRRKTIVEVRQDEEVLFSGLCIEDKEDFYKQRTIVCEGELAYLNDSIQRPARYQGKTVRGLLETYIAAHNAQVNTDRQFTVGMVTVTDSNDTLYRYTNMNSTMKELKEDFVDDLGGFLSTRHKNGVRYIDYLEESINTNSQVIEIGENLMDFTSNIDSSDIATAIIPLGEKLEETAVEGLETRLDIKSINDGKDYVYDSDAVDAYGWIYKTVTWDDVSNVTILKSKGEKYLADIQFENMVIQAKAIDLHLTDKDIEAFKLSDEIRVVSKPHGLDRRFRLTKMTIYLNAPEKNTITLGKSEKTTLSAQTNKVNEEIKKAVDSITPADDILSQAKDNATQLITNAMGGYVVKTNDELLIMDTPDKSTARKIWRWNMNGLGYSSTGYNGEYGTAITMDGSIVGERISIKDLYSLNAKIAGWNISEKSINSTNDNNGKFTRIDIAQGTVDIDGTPSYMLNTYEYTNVISAPVVMESDGIIQFDGDVTWTGTGIECKRIFRLYDATGNKVYEWSDYDGIGLCGLTSVVAGTYTATFSVEVTDIAGHDPMTITCEPWFDKKITTPSSIYMYSVEDTDGKWFSAKYNGREMFYLTKQGILHAINADFTGNIKSGSDSTYAKMNYGELDIVENGKMVSKYDQKGSHYYENAVKVGKIGTNHMSDDATKRGLVFDIEKDAAYTSWSSRNDDTSDYIMKWTYASKAVGGYAADRLHAGCDIDMHNFKLRNVTFEDGGITGTLKFKQILTIASDGKAATWADATLVFKNGILTSGTWS